MRRTELLAVLPIERANLLCKQWGRLLKPVAERWVGHRCEPTSDPFVHL